MSRRAGPAASAYTFSVDPSIEERFRDFFARRGEGIVTVYLFGSHARGMARPSSDVDIAVLWESGTSGRLASPALVLEGELERELGQPVEVLALNSAPVDLVHRVLRDGRILFEANRSARIAFEVKARNEYFDLLPVLRTYRRVGRAS